MAADIVDQANSLASILNDTALNAQIRKHRFHLPSLSKCKDCDDDIPKARQALGGVTRCVECEGDVLQARRQKGLPSE